VSPFLEPGQKPSGHLAGIRGCDEEPGDEPDRNDQEESDDDSLERSLTPFVLNQKKTKGHQAGDQPTEQHRHVEQQTQGDGTANDFGEVGGNGNGLRLGANTRPAPVGKACGQLDPATTPR
jgi:hypothetical protein